MPYQAGTWNVICDRCGGKYKNTEVRKEWTGLYTCLRGCWEPRQPQDFVRGRADKQTVPFSRPETSPALGSTTLGAAAAKWATTITVASISRIADGDAIGVVLNDSAKIHWTTVDGTPAGTSVVMADGMIEGADSGNTVYTPAADNKNYIEAGDLSPSDL